MAPLIVIVACQTFSTSISDCRASIFFSMILYIRVRIFLYEGARTIFRALQLSWSLLQPYISAVLM